MKPPRFKYAVPESLEEAIALLDEYGDDAKVLAGGQSLIPLLNMRLARPAVLVDINRIASLQGIDQNGGLTIKAMTRQIAVARSSAVRYAVPIVVDAFRHVGHVGIRSRGTFGGIVAHADSAAELPAVLLTLGAEIVAQGPAGERAIPVDEFFVSTFTSALAPNEILTRIRIPAQPAGARWGFCEVARRHGDYALVGVATTAAVDANGICTSARIALSGVADRPVRVPAAEQALVGKPAGDSAAAEEAGRLARTLLDPPADFHASALYRLEVSQALVTRAVKQLSTQKGAH